MCLLIMSSSKGKKAGKGANMGNNIMSWCAEIEHLVMGSCSLCHFLDRCIFLLTSQLQLMGHDSHYFSKLSSLNTIRSTST